MTVISGQIKALAGASHLRAFVSAPEYYTADGALVTPELTRVTHDKTGLVSFDVPDGAAVLTLKSTQDCVPDKTFRLHVQEGFTLAEAITAGGFEVTPDNSEELKRLVVEAATAKFDAVERAVREMSLTPGPKGDKGEPGQPGAAATFVWEGTALKVNDLAPVDLKGERGLQGPQGDRGAPGAPGERGQDGLPGATGERGPQGEKGERGEPGPPGADGQPGRDGQDGAPGKDGTMTFEQLTQEQRESLRGPQGEPGKDGERGPAGERGLPGERGADGAQGIPGERGPQGDPGQPGEKGATGERGIPGPQGEPGKDGAPGAKGAPGLPGAPGPDGAKGDPGAPGQPGADGKPGPQGPAGIIVSATQPENPNLVWLKPVEAVAQPVPQPQPEPEPALDPRWAQTNSKTGAFDPLAATVEQYAAAKYLHDHYPADAERIQATGMGEITGAKTGVSSADYSDSRAAKVLADFLKAPSAEYTAWVKVLDSEKTKAVK